MNKQDFIPEYAKCINPKGWIDTIKSNNNNLIFDTKIELVIFNNTWKKIFNNDLQESFINSTKEEYEAQFKDNFILPEKWIILKNKIENNDWKLVIDYFNKGCNTTTYNDVNTGFYYPNFSNFIGFKEEYHSGRMINSKPYNEYTEITFDQFKEYILKQNIDELEKSLKYSIEEITNALNKEYDKNDIEEVIKVIKNIK